jgi:hypothetical protein
LVRSVIAIVLVACVGLTANAEDPGPTLVRNFDLRGDARSLFETVSRSFGLTCVFDSDYQAGPPIRFRLEEADYGLAMRALEAATRSFTTPLTPTSILVANDTPEKRGVFEPFVALTVEIPQATTKEELTNLLTGVQQVMALEKAAIVVERNQVVLRGAISKVSAARALLEGLMQHHPEVSIEMELREVDKDDLFTYGLDLPTLFQIVNIGPNGNPLVTLRDLARKPLSFYGINIANAALLAQMQRSNTQTLLSLQLRSTDNRQVTFHAGDRYPIVTNAYVGSPTPTSTSGSTGTSGTGGTTPAGVFGNVPNPSGVSIANFDADGIPDFAASSAGGNYVAVFPGKGDGTFGSPSTFPVGTSPAAIATADLNADGFQDIVTVNAGSNDVSVLLGKGDGTFDAALSYAVGSHPVALAIADFNGDGRPDIAVANANDNTVSILLGDGDGGFTASGTVGTGTTPSALVAADLDRDGNVDLAIVNSVSNDLWIYFGNGDGTFRTGGTFSTGTTPLAVTAADLNLDGNRELIVANSADNTVSVYMGQGAGAFAPGVAYPAGIDPIALAVRDFNFDGAPDVLVANGTDAAVSQLLGNLNGTLRTPIRFAIGPNPGAMDVADIDRNNTPDVITANSATDNFSVLLTATSGSFIDPSGHSYPATGQSYAPPPTFQFEDIGLVLKATPHVNSRSEVTLDLEAEFKALTGGGVAGLPIIASRKLATRMSLPNGEWVMVAGLLTKSDSLAFTGFPIKTIARRTKDRSSTEVVILLRTTLLSPPAEELLSFPIPLGSDTRPRAPM